MSVDSILKELLQLNEPSSCASCEEFLIPQLGERRLTGSGARFYRACRHCCARDTSAIGQGPRRGDSWLSTRFPCADAVLGQSAPRDQSSSKYGTNLGLVLLGRAQIRRHAARSRPHQDRHGMIPCRYSPPTSCPCRAQRTQASNSSAPNGFMSFQT